MRCEGCSTGLSRFHLVRQRCAGCGACYRPVHGALTRVLGGMFGALPFVGAPILLMSPLPGWAKAVLAGVFILVLPYLATILTQGWARVDVPPAK